MNTSFATKAISDRFPHFGATKIGDSGRHGNPHFSVFYTRFAAQSGYISFERRKCPIARRRIPLNRSTSGVRAPPAAFSSRRPCPRRADDPSGGRRSDGGKDAEGRVRNRRPTILPRPDGKRPVRPRIPARRQRSGAPKRSSVPQKRRTSLPADELRIARDIGSADDRLPVLARHAAERLPPRPAIPNTVFGATRDDRRAGFCTIRKYRHFYTPESALFRSDRGAVRHRRGRISGRGSLGKEYRYAGHCRPTASYIGPAPTRLNVPASGGDFRSRPHRTGRQFRRFAPDRPSCTALAGGADTSVGERHLPRHNGRSIRLIAEHGLSTTGKRRPRPSPRANERRRSEKRALPHPTRFRSEAAHSRRRLRPPGGSGSVSNRAKKQIEAARSVSSTAVEVPSEHAYSAASCNLEWQTTKTRQANESFAAASGEPLIRGKYENCNDRKEAV